MRPTRSSALLSPEKQRLWASSSQLRLRPQADSPRPTQRGLRRLHLTGSSGGLDRGRSSDRGGCFSGNLFGLHPHPPKQSTPRVHAEEGLGRHRVVPRGYPSAAVIGWRWERRPHPQRRGPPQSGDRGAYGRAVARAPVPAVLIFVSTSKRRCRSASSARPFRQDGPGVSAYRPNWVSRLILPAARPASTRREYGIP